jgi:IS5 family transposase
VRDQLSFRRFCGLSLEADTPDHASIWRFRQTIDKLGLSAALLSETNRQPDALGLIAKAWRARGRDADRRRGQASALRKRRRQFARPGRVHHDEAMKRKTAHFGYKAHLAVGEESGLVRQAEMTSPMSTTPPR